MPCCIPRAAMAESVKAEGCVSTPGRLRHDDEREAAENFLTSRGDGEWEQPLGNDRMGIAHHASHQVPDRLNRVD